MLSQNGISSSLFFLGVCPWDTIQLCEGEHTVSSINNKYFCSINADAYLNEIPLTTSLLCGRVGEEPLDENTGKHFSSQQRKALAQDALNARLGYWQQRAVRDFPTQHKLYVFPQCLRNALKPVFSVSPQKQKRNGDKASLAFVLLRFCHC